VIATIVERPCSTVGKVLRRAGCSRLPRARRDPRVRYERERPGELLHLDTKKLGRFFEVGKRIRRDGINRSRKAGWQQLHVAIDDHSRLAYCEVIASERKEACAAFLRRACAWYREQGIVVERVLTDNAKAYHSHLWRDTCAELGVERRYTRPYSPWTNGKAEALIKTLLREWAYRFAYPTSTHRARALSGYLRWYGRKSSPGRDLLGVGSFGLSVGDRRPKGRSLGLDPAARACRLWLTRRCAPRCGTRARFRLSCRPVGGEPLIGHLSLGSKLALELMLTPWCEDAFVVAAAAVPFGAGEQLKPAQLLAGEGGAREGVVLLIGEHVPADDGELAGDGDGGDVGAAAGADALVEGAHRADRPGQVPGRLDEHVPGLPRSLPGDPAVASGLAAGLDHARVEAEVADQV
jgi:transposase InsO family protein